MSEFVSGVGEANSALDKLRPQATALEGLFGAASDAVENFGNRLWQIASVTIGMLVRDAFRWLGDAIGWVIDKLKDLIGSAIETGSAFQLMKLRLQGFNLQDAINSGMDYTAAMQQAVAVTQQQVDWVMKLAALTPFDAQDILNTYTLAKSYGFTSDAAKEMTQSIVDFTSAMGLGSQEQERIIVNFGQMVQRGKITTREMNDLARGSFLPLADVLDRVAAKMGITTEALTILISKPGEGVDPYLFIDAFNEMIQSEARFQGASVRMAHTFSGAWNNIVETIRDVVGNFIALPGFLDPIGQKFGDIMDAIGSDKNWSAITNGAARVGRNLGAIVFTLLEKFFPAGQTIVDGIVSGLANLADWLDIHKDDIVGFFVSISDSIQNDVIPWITNNLIPALSGIYDWVIGDEGKGSYEFFNGIRDAIGAVGDIINDHVVPAFDEIKGWIDDNGPVIREFWGALGQMIQDVVNDLMGNGGGKGTNEISGASSAGGGLIGALNFVKIVMQFIIDNEPAIAAFIADWIRFWVYVELIKTALQIVLGNLTTLLSLDTSALAAFLAGMLSAFRGVENSIRNILNMVGSLGGSIGKTWDPYQGILPDTGTSESTTSGGKSNGQSYVPSGSAVASVTNSKSTAESNYSLTIHTMAKVEPIIADYQMLKGMA